eukprot:TRINITY_DN5243_c0_g1_i1.p1 TRINITY_DN5243_c0_g1~~TRINITY_DN5243_c0_g1_i1.p1  ORF type:complete len:296 (+),score=89.21 TRINITY_DN5243_c0_g1_i1:101-988(+)
MNIRTFALSAAGSLLLGFSALAELDRAQKLRGPNSIGDPFHYWLKDPWLPILGAVNSLNRLSSRDVTPALDPAYYFPNHSVLEANTPDIRREALRLVEHAAELKSFADVDSARYSEIDSGRQWKVFILKWYGDWVRENCEWAPRTYEILRNMPEVKIAMFSILPPGVGIPLHCGPYCGSVRYHLGLVVPREGEVFISVGGQRLSWEEGKGLLIDDTFQHYVVNNSTGYRVVLFMDVVRRVEWAPVQWVNNFIADNSITRGIFSHYNQKTELQKRLCCGGDCDPVGTFCPSDAATA